MIPSYIFFLPSFQPLFCLFRAYRCVFPDPLLNSSITLAGLYIRKKNAVFDLPPRGGSSAIMRKASLVQIINNGFERVFWNGVLFSRVHFPLPRPPRLPGHRRSFRCRCSHRRECRCASSRCTTRVGTSQSDGCDTSRARATIRSESNLEVGTGGGGTLLLSCTPRAKSRMLYR